MKLGQLIEHNMRNIFLKKAYTRCKEKPVPDLFFFFLNQNWAHLWINCLQYYSLFLLYVQVKNY